MKTKSFIHSALAALALAIASLPQAAPGAFVPNTDIITETETTPDFLVQDFFDGNARAYWLFKRGVPQHTTGLFPTGGWFIADHNLRPDGSIAVLWVQNVNADDRDLALWTINAQGNLIAAATYRTSGWTPVLDADGGVVGDKTVIEFVGFGANAGMQAAWLLGPSGNLLKAYLWAITFAGWALVEDSNDPLGKVFVIIFHHAANRLLTYYVFDDNGNWTNATTYPY